MRRIEICGGIASGKTTLAHVLDSAPVKEDFRGNPFLKLFYNDPAQWFEEKNFFFLIQHIGAIKSAQRAPVVVCDYAVFQDLAYASLAKSPDHLTMMQRLYTHLYQKVGPPDLIVHLRCAPSVELQRIAARGRPEEAHISSDYLSSLNAAIEAGLEQMKRHAKVVTIDSGRVDFASDAACAALLKRDLLAHIRT